MLKRRLFFLMMSVIIILNLTGCSGTNSDSSSIDKVGIYGTTADSKPEIKGSISLYTNNLTELNPFTCSSYYLLNSLQLIYEGLVFVDDYQKIENILLHSYETKDNKTWNITLKDNVQFHDGTVLSGNDVAYSTQLLKKSKNISQYNGIKNVKSVSASGNVVTFVLKNYDPNFIYNLTFPIIKSNYKNKDLNINPIGTGPYMYSKTSKSSITLNRNPNWHIGVDTVDDYDGVQPPFIEKIVLNKFKSSSDALGRFFTNELDVLPLNSKDLSNIKVETGYGINKFIVPRFTYMIFNTKSPILASSNVRKAIVSLVEKNAISQRLYKNVAISAELPSLKYSNLNKNTINRYDQDLANVLMLEDGWKKGYSWSNSIAKLYFNAKVLVNKDDSKMVKYSDIITKRLELNNFRCTIISVPESQYNQMLKVGNFDITFAKCILPKNGDMSKFYLPQKSGGSFNFSNYSNSKLTDLYKSYYRTTDSKQKASMEKSIVEIIADDMPVCGINIEISQLITNRRIYGKVLPTYRNLYYKLSKCYVAY